MDFKTGGRDVIERLVTAYGFKTRQALCDHLGVSKSTLATRYMRDIFPAEWVIQCALESGANLHWLVTGQGQSFDHGKKDILKIRMTTLVDGELFENGFRFVDKALLSSKISKPEFIMEKDEIFIVDCGNKAFKDGKWLIEMDGEVSLRYVHRIPGGMIKVTKDKHTFSCKPDEIRLIAPIKGSLKLEISE